MNKEINDYRDLPFSKRIRTELLKRHTHGNIVGPHEIVYREKDVLILLQILKLEIEKPHPNVDVN